MTSSQKKLINAPEGATTLFFIQIFCTLGFAVLYSSLVLYLTKALHFTAKDSTTIMGVFGAFNYGLHMFGGYLGGRFLSNRNLFVGGMVLQILGCACISIGSVSMLYWGLALFLTGSGLNVTCVNMMLTQRFAPDDNRREGAFLWNYAGMNIGFFLGFTGAGHYQLINDYSSLFIFATLGNVVAIIIALATWKTLADLNTPLLEVRKEDFNLRLLAGIAILIGLVPVVWFLLNHPDSTETLVKIIAGLIALAMVLLTVRHHDRRERNNMWAYIVLTLGSLVFWSLYQMAPSGLQLFADNNVDLYVWGIKVAPAWIQNINTVVIVFGGPLMSVLYTKLRARGWKIEVPKQFALSLLLMGAGFLCLPVGIQLADAKGLVPFFWLFLSYIFQSIGELLISPIGYAMIGRLAPKKYQGIMMGCFMLATGVASLFAGDFSGMIPEPSQGTPLTTNHDYSVLFTWLGGGSVAVGVVLTLLIPFLVKLIRDKEPVSHQADVSGNMSGAAV